MRDKARERLLDVSDLPAPEPLEQALAALERLLAGEYLRMVHHREPYLLYPILGRYGFAYITLQKAPGVLEVYIWHGGDTLAEQTIVGHAHGLELTGNAAG